MAEHQNPQTCPLCKQHKVGFYSTDSRRPYYRCEECDLVFVPKKYHLSVAREKAEYDKHQNSAGDPGYRQFLNRLCEPLLNRLKPQSEGLDFGCGPGPALPFLLEERGHSVAVYDKFYACYPKVLQRQYDFVTATEVFEHLADPAQTLNRLWALLKPGGLLGVMTKLVIDKNAFEKWHYKNDPTHIIFFSEKTMHWLARYWRAEFEPVAADAFIFRKLTSRTNCPD